MNQSDETQHYYDMAHQSDLRSNIQQKDELIKEAWNNAIDACILIAFKDDGSYWVELRNKLEALKHK